MLACHPATSFLLPGIDTHTHSYVLARLTHTETLTLIHMLTHTHTLGAMIDNQA